MDRAAQSPMQPALNTFRNGASTASLGNPVPHRPHNMGEVKNLIKTYSQFYAISPCPITTVSDQQSLSSFPAGPFGDWKVEVRSPHNILFSRLSSHNFLSLSSQGKCSTLINPLASGFAPGVSGPSYIEGPRTGCSTPVRVSSAQRAQHHCS